jgi:hypothetical protein
VSSFGRACSLVAPAPLTGATVAFAGVLLHIQRSACDKLASLKDSNPPRCRQCQTNLWRQDPLTCSERATAGAAEVCDWPAGVKRTSRDRGFRTEFQTLAVAPAPAVRGHGRSATNARYNAVQRLYQDLPDGRDASMKRGNARTKIYRSSWARSLVLR